MNPAPRVRDCESCGQPCAEEWQYVCDGCRTAELMWECPCSHDERNECACEEECPAYGMCAGWSYDGDPWRGDPWVEAGPDD